MDGIGSTSERFKVFAHRGYHGVNGVSENSLGAFEAGIAIGVDALELDVRRTRDGVLVIHHDEALPDGRKLADLNYAELPPLDDGQKIPTLVEVAKLAQRTGAHLSVELKEKGYEDEAAAQLEANVPMSQVEMISFYRSSIKAVEAHDSSIRTGLLSPWMPEWLRNSAFYPAATWVMEKLGWHPSLGSAAKIGADFVSAEQRMVDQSFVDDAHERGIDVYAWTIDDTKTMAELANRGVDGIVTNRPDLAIALRDSATGANAVAAAA